MENQLAKVINESGLDKTKAQVLLENFSNYFEIASDWENKAKALVITNIEQKAEMKMAREGRLFLKEKRVAVEKTRKSLKENVLREGQTIDSIAKILTNLILPIEKDLEQKEKFAELQEAKRKAELKAAREMELQPYHEFIPVGLDFGVMDEENYQKFLKSVKIQLQNKLDLEAEIEAKRIAKEKAEQKKNERLNKMFTIGLKWDGEQFSFRDINFHWTDLICLSDPEFEKTFEEAKKRKEQIENEEKQENERLKKEAEAKEKQLAKERAKAESERKKIEEAAKKEREEKERLQAEIRAKAEAEEKARKEAADKLIAEQKAKELAEKKAMNAPDKIKLLELSNRIENISLPELKSDEAIKILSDVKNLLSKVTTFIKEKSETI
jgi:colicin import membrane protein